MESVKNRTENIKIRNKSDFNLSKKYNIFAYNSLLCVLSFLFGRIGFEGGMSPAGIALCTVLLGRSAVFYPACLFSFLGCISKGGYGMEGHTAALFVLVILGFVLERKTEKISEVKKAVLPAICLLLGGILQFVLKNFDIYIILRYAVEGVLCFFITVIFSKAMKAAARKNISCINDTEWAAVFFAISLFISSFVDFPGFGTSLYIIMSVFFVLFLGMCFPSVSAEFGIILGFTLYLSNGADNSFLLIICLSSLMCGFFGGKSKLKTILSFLAGSTLAVFYTDMESDITLAVSAVAATVIFSLFPDKLIKNMHDAFYSDSDEASVYIKSAKDILSAQIGKFSSAFRSLAEAFEPETDTIRDYQKRKNDVVVDEAAQKACRNCTMSVYCWSNKASETLSGFYYLINECEKNNMADEKSMPENFRQYCIKPKKLCDAVLDSFKIIKNNSFWQKRLLKSRGIISEQLYSAADIIEDMSKKTDISMLSSMPLAKELSDRLEQNGIKTEQVYVFNEPDGRMAVTVKRKNCRSENHDCWTGIIPVANAVCKRSFVKSRCECAKKGLCSVTLRQTDCFGFKYSTAEEKSFESDVSGDSFLVSENPNGILTVAVSDGMGTGKRAKEESQKAMELLKKFSSAGFDAGVSAGILNSVLLGRGDGELFTTLDVCCVDMYTGRGQLIKNGGSTAFIIRDGRVTSIRSTSLPIGILKSVDSDITNFKLEDGDMLLMVTDGVVDADRNSNEEYFIEQIMKKIHSSDTSLVAKKVISEAKKLQNGKSRDDMLAVCVKIFEKH